MTPKQEKFCQLYIEWGNASQAYREAYNADTMKADTIHRKAKELLDNGKITARLNELKRTQYERHNITVDKILAELEQARIIALESQNAPAMINATMAKENY